MAFGYIGKILHVDLTNRKIDVEEKDDIFYRSHLGGRGIGYHYLLKNVPSGVDPFSPENVLVFATGVMTGAPGGLWHMQTKRFARWHRHISLQGRVLHQVPGNQRNAGRIA